MEKQKYTPKEEAFFQARDTLRGVFEDKAQVDASTLLTHLPIDYLKRKKEGTTDEAIEKCDEQLDNSLPHDATGQNIFQLYFFGDEYTKPGLGELHNMTRQGANEHIEKRYKALRRDMPLLLPAMSDIEKPLPPEMQMERKGKISFSIKQDFDQLENEGMNTAEIWEELSKKYNRFQIWHARKRFELPGGQAKRSDKKSA